MAAHKHLVTGYLFAGGQGPVKAWVDWEIAHRERNVEPLGPGGLAALHPAGAWHLAAIVSDTASLDAVAAFAARLPPEARERITLFFLGEDDAERFLETWRLRGLGDVDFTVVANEASFHKRYGVAHNAQTYRDAASAQPPGPTSLRVTAMTFPEEAGWGAAAAALGNATGRADIRTTGVVRRTQAVQCLAAVLVGEEAEAFLRLALAAKGFALAPACVDRHGRLAFSLHVEVAGAELVEMVVKADLQASRLRIRGFGWRRGSGHKQKGRYAKRHAPSRHRTISILRSRYGASVA